MSDSNMEKNGTIKALGGCLNRFLMREMLIDRLRENGDLTDSELALAARDYPQLIVDNMNPDIIIDTGTYPYKPSGQINKIHKLFNYRVLQLWEED